MAVGLSSRSKLTASVGDGVELLARLPNDLVRERVEEITLDEPEVIDSASATRPVGSCVTLTTFDPLHL